jgi:hypothetical protein
VSVVHIIIIILSVTPVNHVVQGGAGGWLEHSGE